MLDAILLIAAFVAVEVAAMLWLGRGVTQDAKATTVYWDEELPRVRV